MPTIRRSQRLIAQKSQSRSELPPPKGVTKRRRRTVLNKESYLSAWLDSTFQTQESAKKRSRTSAKSKLIDSEVSDSNCNTDDETGDSDIECFLGELTPEHLEFLAGHDLKRLSHDSRFQPGNEDYEIDGFVVDDLDEDEECSNYNDGTESEITLMPSPKPKRKLIRKRTREESHVDAGSTDDDAGVKRPKLPLAIKRRKPFDCSDSSSSSDSPLVKPKAKGSNICASPTSTRHISSTSTRKSSTSSDSKLFHTDADDNTF